MNISLISVNGNVNIGNDITNPSELKKELMLFAGHMLGKCYTPNDYETICKEPEEKTLGRANFCIKNGHHSGFEHVKLTFEMNNVPKIIFMLLNNENVYTTSEQSARYTDFSEAPETQRERDLYVKWCKILEKEIAKEYPKLDEKRVKKLAQENARYHISVFVKSSMFHTIDLRQLNYIMVYFKQVISEPWARNDMEKKFVKKITPLIEEFLHEMEPYKIEGLVPKPFKQLSFFKNALHYEDVFEDVYAITYKLSWAAQAQNHRHRTCRYIARIPKETEYFMPYVIRGKKELEEEWLKDIMSVADVFPQGMFIEVRERGTVEDFVEKCYERLCGCAQAEIMNVTLDTLKKMEGRLSNRPVYNYIYEKTGGFSTARCMFPEFKCTNPCEFGAKQSERKV